MEILKYSTKKTNKVSPLRWKRNKKLLMPPVNGMDLVWKQLLDKMSSANGIGLAASQVGLCYRAFVTSILSHSIISFME